MQACLFIETKMIGMCVCVCRCASLSVIGKDAPGSHRCLDATFLHQPVVEGKIIKVLHWVGVEAMYPGFS